jgi:NTP pyrophosphatase (non-canonical NTP hydrolase)
MRVDDYQDQAVASDQSQGQATARYLLLGVFGEAGGLLTAVKKRERDAETIAKYLAQVTEEVGDLLWYLAAVAHRNGVSLSTLIAPLIDPPPRRLEKIQFSDLQPSLTRVSPDPSRTLELRLVRLAAAIGALVDAQTESLHTRTRTSPNEEFTEVFKWLESMASYVGVSLEDAAVENLAKVRDRWPPTKIYIPPFDDSYPEYERLPRQMIIDIREIVPKKDQYFVLQTCERLHVGDRLTDNIEDPDEYRFHDVFHYAYVAVLGWSPVVRSLLRLKRKSNKVVDETQDGARAILIEEGIAAFVFSEAKSQAFFRNVQRGKLSFDLLKRIRAFVRGYEAQDIPLWLWEEAILQGFEAFRFLQEHRAARVTISYAERRLNVERHP